jgi:NAD+ synthase (glutamine-hydrolysing)
MTIQLQKICIAQLNYVVGDIVGNAKRIIDSAKQAYALGARLVITPELSICGYACEDLFLRPSFNQACDDALNMIAKELEHLSDLHVIVGHPSGTDLRTKSVSTPKRQNKASVLCEGRIKAHYAKQQLPNYQVFDERRYFEPGNESCVFEVLGLRVGLLICEDAWFEGPALACAQAGAELLVVLNASPFHVGKGLEREQAMRVRAEQTQLPLIYAHMVGGQDEVVFEGRSFVMDAQGQLVARAKSFEEELFEIQISAQQSETPKVLNATHLNSVRSSVHALCFEASIEAPGDNQLDLWRALVVGVRDYIEKNRFPGVIIGLSGGIDSALVLAIAVDALGPKRVRAVMMPSEYTAQISWIDAKEMANRLGVQYDEISIRPEFECFLKSLEPEFSGLALDATEENIQARIRGTLLMALSNKKGSIVLTTGNKSEMATGYCTLYGDMAGGFAVIKDVAKTTVFELAWWRNANDPFKRGENPIPERIITRPPSAELRPDQKDQDSLPAYDVLDAILERYMEQDMDVEQIISQGFERATVERVAHLIKINEYKRRQSPIGIRITHRSFGKDWRYPITNRFKA